MVIVLRDPFENKEMCFGVHLAPVQGFETLKIKSQNAENLGYDLVTVWDHLMFPENVRGRTYPPLQAMECWTSLAGIAAVTDSIQIGSLVSCVHYRHPTILAKMAVTVDLISKGRLILGIGAGWLKEEFESFLGRFPSLKKRIDGLEDAAIICKSMLEDDYTDYRGKLYSAIDIPRERSTPKPVRGFIPIMIGGSGERRTLKIAARYADLVHISQPLHPRLLDRKIQALKNHCRTVGRDFEDITLSTFIHPSLERTEEILKARARGHVLFGISESKAKESADMTTGPENIVETIKQSYDMGVKLFTLYSGFTELEQFKKEVISKL
jgi:alkanesulfonate monooxygenase SsuD/methylene tetrahydromethanopterin reductase-like flavin-dependent oxidoreductase (luciferase family)